MSLFVITLTKTIMWRDCRYLESAHVIKIKATNKFTLIRATNWQSYQETDTDTAQQTRKPSPPAIRQIPGVLPSRGPQPAVLDGLAPPC